jgi:hypothetical protein
MFSVLEFFHSVVEKLGPKQVTFSYFRVARISDQKENGTGDSPEDTVARALQKYLLNGFIDNSEQRPLKMFVANNPTVSTTENLLFFFAGDSEGLNIPLVRSSNSMALAFGFRSFLCFSLQRMFISSGSSSS